MGKFQALAVVTIEGGGAYGFSLLGQLQAVVASEVQPIALAGTSAGAIIATLHWAGYTPREIKDKFCELADKQLLTDLLGPFDNGANGQSFDMAAFEQLKTRLEQRVKDGPDTLKQFQQLIDRLQNAGWNLWNLFRLIGEVRTARKSFDELLENVNELLPHFRNRGVFRGDQLVDTIDGWLRQAPCLDDEARAKLEQRKPRSSVAKITFGDMSEATWSEPLRPLFLPVTNVTQRKLEIVCSLDPTYHNWQIARAVRASAGFPAFFRPIQFGHSQEESDYVDGGVIANYPAWIFGHQFRESLHRFDAGKEFAIRPWVHVGLCLGSPTHPPKQDAAGPSSFPRNFLALMTGGARQELEKRLTDLLSRSIEIRQPEDETDAPESLLDFATCDRPRIEKMFKRGFEAAKRRFDQHDFSTPDLKAINPTLESLLQQALICLGQPLKDGRPDNSFLKLRSNVFMPSSSEPDRWTVAYSANMAGDPDSQLALPKFAGLSGMCVGLRRPLICNLEQVRKASERQVNTGRLFGMTPDLQKQVLPDRTWLASIPIFDQYACYPTRVGDSFRPFEGRSFQEFEPGCDGAVIAVLNLDAKIDYAGLNLDPDPEIHWTDVRIRTIIDVMRGVALGIGNKLTQAFGRKT